MQLSVYGFFPAVDAPPLKSESKTSAISGERKELECHGGSIWSYQRTKSNTKDQVDIVVNGEIIKDYVKDFELSKSQHGGFNLVLRNASTNHSGYYSCLEEHGRRTVITYELTVQCKCAQGHGWFNLCNYEAVFY